MHTDSISEEQCDDLLSGEAMQELTGEQGSFRLHDVGDLPACQALTAGDNGMRITVVRVPATQWASSQRQTFADLLPSTGDHVDELSALDDETLTDEAACELFEALMEHTHGGAAPWVVATASLGRLQTIAAQACTSGEFSLVTAEETGEFELTPQRRTQFRAALQEVHPEPLTD